MNTSSNKDDQDPIIKRIRTGQARRRFAKRSFYVFPVKTKWPRRSLTLCAESALALAAQVSSGCRPVPVLFFCGERDVDGLFSSFLAAGGRREFVQFLAVLDSAHLKGSLQLWRRPHLIVFPSRCR